MTIYARKDPEYMERTLRRTTSTATREHQRPSRTPWKPHRDPGHMRNDYANMIISSVPGSEIIMYEHSGKLNTHACNRFI